MINPERFFQFNEEKPFKLDAQNELQVSVRITPDTPYFEGHFKDNPVLPAIALMDLSLVVVNACHSNVKKTFLTIKSAKFSDIVRPNDMIKITMKCDEGNQNFSVDFANQNDVSVAKLAFSAH